MVEGFFDALEWPSSPLMRQPTSYYDPHSRLILKVRLISNQIEFSLTRGRVNPHDQCHRGLTPGPTMGIILVGVE